MFDTAGIYIALAKCSDTVVILANKLITYNQCFTARYEEYKLECLGQNILFYLFSCNKS